MVDKLSKEELAQSYVPRFKTCADCRRVKPRSDFYEGRGRCRLCYSEANRLAYLARRPEPKPKRVRKPMTADQKLREKSNALRRRFGMTLEERDEMLAAQGGVCKICRSTEPSGHDWCVDHDHSCCPSKSRSCGECIRGILCFRCNTVLGHAKDNAQILRAAAEFIEDWEARRGG